VIPIPQLGYSCKNPGIWFTSTTHKQFLWNCSDTGQAYL